MSNLILPESQQWYDGPPLKGIGPEHLRDRLILPSHISPNLYGLAGDMTAINGDDAAAAGTTGRLADAGHQHPWETVAPSALTLTATNSEGAANSGVRSDHGHGTAALPWGRVAAPQRFTTNNGPHSVTGNTDFVFTNLSMLSTRWYKACLHTAWSRASAATWLIELTEDGNKIAEYDITDSDRDICSEAFPFTTTTATHTYRIRVNEVSAGGDLTLTAAATAPRLFWLEDIGPV
jgi:hypothetical protein